MTERADASASYAAALQAALTSIRLYKAPG